jgi:hypothetical protein
LKAFVLKASFISLGRLLISGMRSGAAPSIPLTPIGRATSLPPDSVTIFSRKKKENAFF